MTKLIAADGHSLDAYEVKPAGARSAVVVIQEIFGVNSHIRAVVDGFAAAGYHAIAPALFDRAQAGVELEYTAEGVAAGRDYRSQLEWDDSMHDVAATVAHAAKTGPVGLVGYCYGGSVTALRRRQSCCTLAHSTKESRSMVCRLSPGCIPTCRCISMTTLITASIAMCERQVIQNQLPLRASAQWHSSTNTE